MSHAVLQGGHRAEGRARRRSRAARCARARAPYGSRRRGGGPGHLGPGRPIGPGPQCRPRGQPAAAVPEGDPRLLPQPRLRLRQPGRHRRSRPDRAGPRGRDPGGRRREPLRHSHPGLAPPRRHPGRGEQAQDGRAAREGICEDPAARLDPRVTGDRRAVHGRDDGPIGREDGQGKQDLPRGPGPLGPAQPSARRAGQRRRPAHRGDRAGLPEPSRRPDRHGGQRHPARHVARADGQAQARVRPPLWQRHRRELLAPHGRRCGGAPDERRGRPGPRIRAACLRALLRDRGGGSGVAAAAGAGVHGPPGAGAGRRRVEGPGADRDPRGVRRPGALQPEGLRGAGLGDQRGHHQRDGRLHRDRAPLRRHGRPTHHHARERDEAARRAIRAHLGVRAGRDGVRHRAGAALMPGPALTWKLADGVAIVTFDLKDSPVNKFSRAVKDEFLATFTALEQDRAVRAIAVFSGKPDNFIAGADIEEFVTIGSAAEAERLAAEGQEMMSRVTRFPKPVAVGIHGVCLGGGLEFALACHYRVATDHPKTQLGLPEVQLGILPGASGCQRLPRLIGARAALDIILAGRSERAPKAFRLGMVDELVHPAILQDITIAAARRLADGWRPRRRRPGGVLAWLLDRNPLGRRLVFRTARRQVLERTKGHYPAPLAALEAVEHGLKHGMAEGLKREARLFGQLAVTDVSRKLVQIFFATTQLKKDFGLPNAPPPTAVQRLGIVGAGFMGSGIAGTAIVQAGVDVRMKDADLPRVAKGLAAAREILDDRLKRRRITKYEHARLVALLSGGDTYAGVGRAELVIEAVFEDLAVKQQVLREVEGATRPDAVFASNTSTIPIHEIADVATRPERVIGMHFFSPLARMPLLEVIPSARTSPGVVSTAVAFGRRMGKTAIVVKDSPGFWINRILTPYMNEAGYLLAEGVAIEELDGLMAEWGFPVGPITLLDEVGMDVAEKVAGVMHAAFGERLASAPAFAAMVKSGRLGRKAGKGFYKYAGGKKGAVDAGVYELIGVHPNGGPRPAEIIQRLVLMMLNEAARAVAEGIVRTPRDGDIGAIFGFGFPPFRGGPLRHADDLGAARIVGELERLAERYGPRFAPSEALRDQAAHGGKFYP